MVDNPAPAQAAPVVRIAGRPYTLAELSDLYVAARHIVRGVSRKARRNGGTHYVADHSLEALAKAIGEPWQ